jgi:hypothetical protein
MLDINPIANDLVASTYKSAPELVAVPILPSATQLSPVIQAETPLEEPVLGGAGLSTVREQLRRRLGGAPHRLLLTRRIAAANRPAPAVGHLDEAPDNQTQLADPRETDAEVCGKPQRTNRFSVVVAPRLPNGELLFAVRFSYATGEWGLELPRLCDQDEDDGWLDPAERSLADCGLICESRMAILGALTLDPPLASPLLALFAEGCEISVATLRDDIDMLAGVVAMAPAVAGQLARNGHFGCAVTLATLQLLRSRVCEL